MELQRVLTMLLEGSWKGPMPPASRLGASSDLCGQVTTDVGRRQYMELSGKELRKEIYFSILFFLNHLNDF